MGPSIAYSNPPTIDLGLVPSIDGSVCTSAFGDPTCHKDRKYGEHRSWQEELTPAGRFLHKINVAKKRFTSDDLRAQYGVSKEQQKVSQYALSYTNGFAVLRPRCNLFLASRVSQLPASLPSHTSIKRLSLAFPILSKHALASQN